MTIDSRKIIFLLDLFIALELISLIGLILYFQPRINKAQLLTPAEIIEENETITIFLVGDIMLNRGVEYMVEKRGEGDFKFPFLKIAEYLNKADLLFGNLESPISDKGTRVGSIYSFRAEPKSIEGLVFSGFDILSLANNHAFDYGWEALEDTLERLKEAGINPVGIDSPVIKEIKNTKIAFLAYTNLGLPSWGIGWADWNNLEKIKKDIEEIKNKADFLIVSLHAGEEYSLEPNQFQIDFSRATIEAGADLVIGHHSHVIQKNEKYPSTSPGRVGYIFYSLGNFVFDQNFSEETMKGLLLEVIIEKGEIKEIIPRQIKINDFFQPEIH